MILTLCVRIRQTFNFEIDKENHKMYKVKITTSADEAEAIKRQLPNGSTTTSDGKYQFFINEEVENPDFWVVRNKNLLKRETCNVDRKNTILMFSDPYSVEDYPKNYCRQFGMICSCQENTIHPNVKFMPPASPWWIGKKTKEGNNKYSITYNDLKDKPFPQKTKFMSVITSDKIFTRGHQDRIDFVRQLKATFGDKIDIYGRGFRTFDDKWEVLAPYKYHIAIENTQTRYYWTEALSDCYLTGTFPIYYGCTNLKDYFSDEAFRAINIHHFPTAEAVIKSVDIQDLYEQPDVQKALLEAKNLVLDKYNIFSLITQCCDTLNPEAEKQLLTLKPAHNLLSLRNLYLNVISRNWFKIRSAVRRARRPF